MKAKGESANSTLLELAKSRLPQYVVGAEGSDNADGMRRLLDSEEGHNGWRLLSTKSIKGDFAPVWIVGRILTIAQGGYLSDFDRTALGARQDEAKEIATAADQLLPMIKREQAHRGSMLRHQQFLPECFRDSLRSLADLRADCRAEELDEAVETLGSMNAGDLLIHILSEYADWHKSYVPKPVTANPGSKRAQEKKFARALTTVFRRAFGAPLHDATASFTNAFFDSQDFSETTIRNWSRTSV